MEHRIIHHVSPPTERTHTVDVPQQASGKRSRNTSIDQSVSMESISEVDNEEEEEELLLLDIPDLPKVFGTSGTITQ